MASLSIRNVSGFGNCPSLPVGKRGFLPDAVPEEIIQAALQDAQYSPSNCNTQPWNVHIVSGAKRDELADALSQANAQGKFSPHFSFYMEAFYGPYRKRQAAQGSPIMNCWRSLSTTCRPATKPQRATTVSSMRRTPRSFSSPPSETMRGSQPTLACTRRAFC